MPADASQNDWNKLVGAGVARVELVDGIPTVMERFGERGIWWEAKTDPRYGDISAFYDEPGDYFYAIGGAPITFTDYVNQGYVYQVRVRRKDAFDLSKYEYWWGRKAGWSKNRLTEFNSESAIMWNVGQGQMVYNRHCACYVFVHTSE